MNQHASKETMGEETEAAEVPEADPVTLTETDPREAEITSLKAQNEQLKGQLNELDQAERAKIEIQRRIEVIGKVAKRIDDSLTESVHNTAALAQLHTTIESATAITAGLRRGRNRLGG